MGALLYRVPALSYYIHCEHRLTNMNLREFWSIFVCSEWPYESLLVFLDIDAGSFMIIIILCSVKIVQKKPGRFLLIIDFLHYCPAMLLDFFLYCSLLRDGTIMSRIQYET